MRAEAAAGGQNSKAGGPIDSSPAAPPRFQSFAFEKLAHLQRRVVQQPLCNAFARIQIENQPVGVLDVVNGCIPRMQLDGPDLDQADEAGIVIDPEPDAFAALLPVTAKTPVGSGPVEYPAKVQRGRH